MQASLSDLYVENHVGISFTCCLSLFLWVIIPFVSISPGHILQKHKKVNYGIFSLTRNTTFNLGINDNAIITVSVDQRVEGLNKILFH